HAQALQEELLRAYPENPLYRRQLAYTHASLGTLWDRSRDLRGLTALTRALGLPQWLAASDPLDADARLNAIAARKNLAMALSNFGRRLEAQRLADDALAQA